MDHLSPVQARIDALLSRKDRVLVGLDGMAASGKTTLAARLSSLYPRCAVVHADDFTLPFSLRRPGYFEETLSNIDLTRLDCEVLSPFARGQAIVYRPYVCHPQPGFLAPVSVPADTRLLIVEGAYCLHPALWDRYDLRALSLVDGDTQRARILARNAEAQLERFARLWIPMELRHIAAHNLRERCDLTLD